MHLWIHANCYFTILSYISLNPQKNLKFLRNSLKPWATHFWKRQQNICNLDYLHTLNIWEQIKSVLKLADMISELGVYPENNPPLIPLIGGLDHAIRRILKNIINHPLSNLWQIWRFLKLLRKWYVLTSGVTNLSSQLKIQLVVCGSIGQGLF